MVEIEQGSSSRKVKVMDLLPGFDGTTLAAELSDEEDPAKGASILGRGVISITCMKNLVTSVRKSSQRYIMLGFHLGSSIGGGVFYWDSNKQKSGHNGGTVIDPDRTFPYVWGASNAAEVEAWFAPSSIGSGCFVRVNDKFVTSAVFGDACSDTPIDTYSISYSIKATASKGQTLVLLPGVRQVNGVEVVSSTNIVGCKGSVIKRAGNYGMMLGVFFPNPVGVSISGVEFDNNAPGTAGTHKYSIRIGNAKDVVLSGLRFFNGYDNAIQGNGPDGVYINSNAPDDINNILVEDCEFDGFTRNGCSVTDGVNGLTFRGCTFKNNGLTGLDIEANTGSSVRVRNVIVEHCKFIDNGDFIKSGSSPFPKGHLGLFSSSPSSFHSEDVTIRNNTFQTKTAVNAGGVFSITSASSKNLTISNNTFLVSDSYVSANGAGGLLNLEASSFKSENLKFTENQVINHKLQSYSLKQSVVKYNFFTGSASVVIVGNVSSAQIDVSCNTFLGCGKSTESIVSVAGRGVVVSGNRFVEDRASNSPSNIISTSLARGAIYDLDVTGNTCDVTNNARWGKFFSSEEASGTRLAGVNVSGNRIAGCLSGGIIIRNTLSYPAGLGIRVSDNRISGVVSGRALDFYRCEKLVVSGNEISQSSGGSSVVRLDLSGPTSVSGNIISWSGASPPSFSIEFGSPQISNSSVVTGNISSGVPGGNSIATAVVAANNVVI